MFHLISAQNSPSRSLQACPDPSAGNGSNSFQHDALDDGTVRIGGHALPRCNGGFSLTGGIFPILCEEHGIWSRPLPQCIPDDEGE